MRRRDFIKTAVQILASYPIVLYAAPTRDTLCRSEVNAHGGGVLFINGWYYWYGEFRESKNGLTQKVSLYKSKDLESWYYVKIIFDITNTNLNIERPKIIFNKNNNEFVLWLHVERINNFSYSKAGVAKSKCLNGEFKDLSIISPRYKRKPISDDQRTYKLNIIQANDSYAIGERKGQMFRDMTIFKDDDESAYVIYASEDNYTIQIAKLDDDYYNFSDDFSRVMVGLQNEAPAVFKRNGIYYLITSGVHGYATTLTRLLMSKSMLEGWSIIGSPFKDKNKYLVDNSFLSQVSFVFHDSNNERYIYVGDKWFRGELNHSTYLWLPITWDGLIPSIKMN